MSGSAGTASQLPPRVRLVVLFGGRSAEHEISCISAGHVLAAVDRGRYDVVPVAITRAGEWMLAADPGALESAGGPTAVDTTSAPTEPAALEASGRPTQPLAVLRGSEAGAAESPPASPGVRADGPTVVLPLLHGPNGEDGTVQGLLQLAGVPWVGAGVLSSAVAMDKAMAKTVLDAHGIPQTAWRAVARTDAFADAEARAALDELGPTVFVKPANMGSSIGVTKVVDGSGATGRLVEAVAEARRFDTMVVLESGVEGRELEVAVLGNDDPRASVVGEIVTDAEFYDYGDKYFDGTARTEIPADLEPAVSDEARALAVRTFRVLRCTGMARVDLFLDPSRGLLVNEVNTIPGFTPISMYPKMWQATGLEYPDLIDELVRLAIEEHERRSALAVEPT